MKKKTIKEINKRINELRIGAFVSVSEDYKPSSRPMTLQEWDSENNLWFFTSKETDVSKEIASNNKVAISFKEGKSEYYTLNGEAVLVDDQEEINKRWSVFVKAWFPEGKEDKNVVLIKVNLTEVTYWDDDSSMLTKGFKLADALISEKTFDGGVHGTISV